MVKHTVVARGMTVRLRPRTPTKNDIESDNTYSNEITHLDTMVANFCHSFCNGLCDSYSSC